MMDAPRINEIRLQIYRRTGVLHYSRSYRPRKLRKLCEAARGLDLRKKEDVLTLAQRLGLISNVIHVDFSKAA